MDYQFADLTDDLSKEQWQQLLHWLWVHSFIVKRSSIKHWRKINGLPRSSS